MRKMLTALMCLAIVACTDHVRERWGPDIEVVPVTYSITLESKSPRSDKTWNELDSYVKKHWDIIATHTVTIYWHNSNGKSLADKYAKYLLSLGVDSQKLSVKQATSEGSELFSGDLKLEVIVNRVLVDSCDYVVIGNYGAIEEGCFVGNARWQSMVNPEKMIRKE